MKKQPQDERVLAQKRKITSEAYSLLLLVLWGSVFVQQFWLKAPLSQYAVEFFCAIGSSYYIIVRNLMAGNSLFPDRGRQKKLLLTNSLVMATTITIVNTWLSYKSPAGFRLIADSFALTVLVNFSVAFATGFLLFALMIYFNQKRQQQIERRLDDDEL